MALFTRTGPDRFNILIRFYGLNIGRGRTLYEPLAWTDQAAGTTRREYQENPPTPPPPPPPPPVPITPPPPSLSSTHNSNEKTWPWSRQCKSNREEIDGWNDSELVRRDSCSRQLRAIGLEIDASEDTAPKLFPSFSQLRRYSANTSRVQGSDYYQLIYRGKARESWLMNGMIQNSSV